MDAKEKQRFAVLARAVAERRDQTAFSHLYDYFAPRLKSWLLRQRMAGGEAEELVQEVMIVLWHKAGLYDPARSSLSTWIFRIARNRRIDLQRRSKIRVLDDNDPGLQPIGELAADVVMEYEDRDAQVRAAMAELPHEQQELLRAAFFLGQSHSEIAAITGLPLGTVKSRIRLAFGKLKKRLEAV
ncbi:sigma-70 family RNA polymerase sigma factor [Rhizobium tumorigenes]|uniref:Sigma-70 family RNA polymerase sigma factor n=1 Tax=Rhizobium tumorigenes TaxID=2041385 RepID=A0AAF1K3C9_9HYPH|nr:sigma-70 family RNA polymerase sigma factor [Rhizobium tumorigenes]WFR95002.1 sigma-70 family RNA polymerase sigma factor [Rhizobium tumorigenes]